MLQAPASQEPGDPRVIPALVVGVVGGLAAAAVITVVWRALAWPGRAELAQAALFFVMALSTGRVARPPRNRPMRVLLFALAMAALGALGSYVINRIP